MKCVIPNSPDQVARRKILMSTKAKQAARRAELLRESARRAKVEMKAARKLYKRARKAARKAKKKAERLAEQLELFIESTARRGKKTSKSSGTPKQKARRRVPAMAEVIKTDAPPPQLSSPQASPMSAVSMDSAH